MNQHRPIVPREHASTVLHALAVSGLPTTIGERPIILAIASTRALAGTTRLTRKRVLETLAWMEDNGAIQRVSRTNRRTGMIAPTVYAVFTDHLLYIRMLEETP